MHKDKFSQIKKDLNNSLKSLKEALDVLDSTHEKRDRGISLDAVAKRFEVAFEYMWKLLKAASEYEGTEAPGPRPAITSGIQYGWIKDPEKWVEFLNTRNAGVHDYLGVSDEVYAKTAKKFLDEAKKVVSRMP